jgi:hypothetical protein
LIQIVRYSSGTIDIYKAHRQVHPIDQGATVDNLSAYHFMQLWPKLHMAQIVNWRRLDAFGMSPEFIAETDLPDWLDK